MFLERTSGSPVQRAVTPRLETAVASGSPVQRAVTPISETAVASSSPVVLASCSPAVTANGDVVETAMSLDGLVTSESEFQNYTENINNNTACIKI